MLVEDGGTRRDLPPSLYRSTVSTGAKTAVSLFLLMNILRALVSRLFINERGNSMLNIRKLVTALVLGLVLSLALLTTGFAQTAGHAQQAVATHTSTTQAAHCGGCGWGWGDGGWGWGGGWGGWGSWGWGW